MAAVGRPVVILAADVVGYSRLIEAGEESTLKRPEACQQQLVALRHYTEPPGAVEAGGWSRESKRPWWQLVTSKNDVQGTTACPAQTRTPRQ